MKTAFPSIIALVLLAAPIAGQERRALDHADYDVWNRIQGDVLSTNGEWLAYRLVPGDGDALLVVQGLRTEQRADIPRGTSVRFTADSRYLIAQIEPMEDAEGAEGERGEGSDAPNDSLAIVDLGNLSVERIANVESFTLPEDDGAWLAYLMAKDPEDDSRQESEEATSEDDMDEDSAAPRLDNGQTLVVRGLQNGSEREFEHAVEYHFSADGAVLYYTASGEDGEADGVFRVESGGGAEAVVSGAGRYTQLAVSDGGAAAFLSDRDDRDDEAPDFALYMSDGGSARQVASPAGGAGRGVPAGWAPSQHGDVSFSDSGRRVMFGTAPRTEPDVESEVPEDERVQVDIWNWKDPLLQPMQLVQRSRELERTYLAVFDVDSDRVLQLATPDVPDVSVGDDGDGDYAVGMSNMPYRQLISWDGRYSDLYTFDMASGASRRVAEMVRGGGTLSPGERYITRWDGFEKAWFAIDVASGESINLTASLDVPVHDLLDDHPDALRPYGSAGWTEDDEYFLVYDEFDIWAVDPTGRESARNLTEGAGRADRQRFRYIDLDRDEAVVPWGENVMLSSFDIHSKRAGIWRDRFDRDGRPVELVSADARFAGVRKAEDADVVTFTRSTFRDFPDIWATDLDIDSPRRVTDANPQQDEYSWGSAEIVEWTSMDGIELQGILYKPDNFDPTREYPMMVYFYERSSDGLHQYFVPAPGGSSIDRSFYVSRGYLLFVPDIPYRIGYPGESALDAVVPGVLELVEDGFVDRERIGVQGHSWGGYQISYMITRTDLFAAAEAGAPVSNMVSAYGGIRWQSGMSRAFQYERTQSRIGGSLWDKPLRYIENSPIFTADKIRTPLLMMHNDEDGAVPWYQGIELFVALRRLGQPVWMLNYNGEAHGLRQEHNRKDWAIRMQQFFDHYLMGAPAPVWMEEGVPAILKGETLGLELTNTRRRISDDDGEEGRGQ